ncbi:MAG: hypothetical protein WB798_03680 [Nocardioidaceae bacterium]
MTGGPARQWVRRRRHHRFHTDLPGTPTLGYAPVGAGTCSGARRSRRGAGCLAGTYVVHCRILEHEDNDMTQPIRVR